MKYLLKKQNSNVSSVLERETIYFVYREPKKEYIGATGTTMYVSGNHTTHTLHLLPQEIPCWCENGDDFFDIYSLRGGKEEVVAENCYLSNLSSCEVTCFCPKVKLGDYVVY